MAVYVPVVSTFDARGIDKAIKDFKKLEGGANKTAYGLRTLDKAAMNVAKGVGKIGGAAALFGGFAVKQFMDFDQAMNESVAIMGDVSDAMRKQMSNAARQMAKETTFSATESAESFYFLASAGLNAEQSIAALPRVAKFAQAGMFDMALATTLLADAQSALGLRSSDAETNLKNLSRVSDVLVKANILANASVQQFSEALTNKAGASMRSLNIDIEEGVAVLAAFAAVGVKGSEAGTMFNATIRGLTMGVQRFPEVFKKFNIQVYDSSGAMNNLADIIAQMEKSFNGMSVQQKRASLTQLGFTEETLAGTLALLGNSDAIRQYEKDLRDAGGTTEDVANRQLNSLSAQLTLAKNTFQDLAITLGEKLAPIVRNIADTFSTFGEVVGERGVGSGVNFLIGRTINGISSMGAFGKAILVVVGAFALLRVATVTYTATFAVLNAAVQAFNLTLNATKTALMAAGGVTALLAVAGVAYSIYSGRKAQAIQTTKDFREALRLEGDAQQTALQKLYETDGNYRKHIDTMRSLGFTLEDVADYVESGTGSLSKMNFAVIGNIEAGTNMADNWANVRKALGLSSDTSDEQTRAIYNMMIAFGNLRTEQLKSIDAQVAVAKATGDSTAIIVASYDKIISAGGKLSFFQQMLYNRAKAAMSGIATETETSAEETETAFSSMGKTVETAAQKFKSFVSALKGYGSSQKSYTASLKNTEKANKDLTKATTDLTKAQEEFDRVVKGYGAGSKEATQAQQDLEQAQRDATRAGFDVERRTLAIAEAEKELARVMQDPLATADERREAEIALSEARMELTEAEIAFEEATQAVNDAQTLLNETINGATAGSDAYKEAQDKLTEAQDRYAEAVDRVAEAVDREAEAKARLAESERQLRSARGEVTQDQVKRAEKQTGVKSVSKKKRNKGNKAVGGSVMAGEAYIVGERGREMFVPSRSGSIVPNNQMPQGDTYNIVINSKIADESLPDLLVAELRKFNRRSGAIKIQVA